jgi:hypothetical protein
MAYSVLVFHIEFIQEIHLTLEFLIIVILLLKLTPMKHMLNYLLSQMVLIKKRNILVASLFYQEPPMKIIIQLGMK